MFIEIAYGLLGLALVVLVIYLIILFSKIGKVNDQARQISKKAVVVGGKTVKTSVGLKAARMAMKLFK